MTACSAHVAPCGNSYPGFSSIASGVTIHNAHIDQLQVAVNGAYSRLGLGNPSWTTCNSGDVIANGFYNQVKNAVNYLSNTYFGLGNIVTSVFSTGGIIYSSQSNELQTDTNTVRNACYCNYNCTCDPECTCDGDCGCDYS